MLRVLPADKGPHHCRAKFAGQQGGVEPEIPLSFVAADGIDIRFIMLVRCWVVVCYPIRAD